MNDLYIAGQCNLGQSEVRRRKVVALAGLIIALVSFALILVSGAPAGSRAILFFPLMIFSIGYIQSRKKFCLAYGLMGSFNLGKIGEISKVQSREDRDADRKTALKIFLQAILLAASLTIILMAIPLDQAQR
jgi:hypothetical protein